MLLLASSVCGLFKWRQFEPEVILLAVGWYLRFSLSYRDVEELLAERGLHAHHVTVWRWVQRYAPEFQRCLRRHLKPTNDSWRVDASQHFRSFCAARRTLAGYEAIHMIRKGQASGSASAPGIGLLHRLILGLFAATS